MNSTVFKIFLLLIMLSSIAWMDPFRDEVSKGNELLHAKKYSEAKKHYNNAERYAPDEEEKKKLYFNKGTADYLMGNFDNAIVNFKNAMQSEDRDVQKKAMFNIGNSFMKQKKYKDAVKSFINTLKIDPTYKRAKKNIEYILKNKMNKDKKKNKKSKDNKKDKNEKNQNKKNKDNKEKQKNQQNKMNREQIKNILNSMKKKPVRRKKGSNNENRYLKNSW